jgi:hypothetical protein
MFVRIRVALVFSLVILAASTALAEQFTVDYAFERPAIEAVRLGGQDYQRIILPGSPSDGPVGAPRLPARGTSILVPYGQELVSVEIIAGERILLGSGYCIEPVGKPVPMSAMPDETELLQPDAAIYASDQPYPARRFVDVGVQRFRGYPLQILKLQPVEYIPTTGELYYYASLKVVVETRAAVRGAALLRGLENDRREALCRADNTAAAWSYPAEARGGRGYELLIITTPELAASFAPLKTFHDSHGLPTEIRTTAEIGGSDPDLLREYIASEYAANSIEYVLIGGDDDLLPAKVLWAESYVGGEAIEIPGDFFYGCLDGTFNYDGDERWGEPTDGEGGGDVDLAAEVYVGRAPVDNVTEATRFVNKTLWYLSHQHAYLAKVLLVGEDMGWSGISKYSSSYMEELVDGSDAHGYTTVGFPSELLSIDRLYDNPEYSWPNSELIARVNNSVHIINHLGHGNVQWAMKTPNSDIPQFTNTNLCFIYSQTCLAGHFDGPDECWAETAHVKTDHAAFAIIMNTREGWGYNGSTDGPSQRYNREFWNAIYKPDEYYPELARANAHSKEENIWRINENCMRWCFYEITLFGDPTIKLASCRDNGLLTLDRGNYACEDALHLRLLDCGLNLDDDAIETVTINVASGSEPSGETVVLTETFRDSAAFEEELAIGPINSPGVLQVATGDTITATYMDADDGQGGTNVLVTVQAYVDCTPPVVNSVQVIEVGPHIAVVSVTADEPICGTIRYGLDCEELVFAASSSGYSTLAQVPLTELRWEAICYFTVEARDQAGNVSCSPTCYAFNTPAVPDFFTQLFTTFVTENDLDHTSLRFIPNNSVNFYDGCSGPITSFPTDPTGSTSLTFTNNDDGYAQVDLQGGATVELYGVRYGALYVGTNGYITFVAPDTNPLESLEAHFGQPRISGLFHNLVTGAGGSVKWKQLPDRVAVTYNNVREFGSASRSTFQVELYFDGRIVLSYLAVGVTGGLAGLSEGLGVSPDYFGTDLSAMGSCVPAPPVARDARLMLDVGIPVSVSLWAEDDGLPYPPVPLAFSLTSLPVHGTLADPGVGTIGAVPYVLVGGGKQVQYLPAPGYVGLDEFQFRANDGGVQPDGGDSNLGTVTLTVQELPELVRSFPLDGDPGWTMTGQWAFGQPLGGGSHAKDPISGHTGPNVYGYNLAGDYANHMLIPEYLTTGAIDCSELSDVQLHFWRWLGIGGPDEAGVLDCASVEVSNDGVTWAPVWTNLGARSEYEWTRQVYDISAVADSQATVYIRWGMGSTNGSITYPGWNIDDVEIWGIASVPVPGDLDGDGDVDEGDTAIFIAVLFGTDAEPEHMARADLNHSGTADGLDVHPFVDALLTP